MTIPKDLAEKFWKIIEVSNVPWNVIDEIVKSDKNIMRPIQGVCFETLFCKTLSKKIPGIKLKLGSGDSDVDVFLNAIRLQLKTSATGPTIEGKKIAVSLHKTHGLEKRPYNLYKFSEKLFDFLVVLHPEEGILIVPYEEISENNSWSGYMADPAEFEWDSKWKNRWDLLGLPKFKGKILEERTISSESDLPFMSSKTFLEDYEIIETLCNPAYFRAAVMGLKGNIKEHLFIQLLKGRGYSIEKPKEAYPKYDFRVVVDSKSFKVQVKGTSKDMCDVSEEIIGAEIMGTHGRFPERGYRKSYFDYVVIVISEGQLNKDYPISEGLHFLFISSDKLPLHYLIGNGDPEKTEGWGNKRWNLDENKDVIYPNIKLKTKFNKKLKRVEAIPAISRYGKYRGFNIIPKDSPFRNAGPFIMDKIPSEFKIEEKFKS